MSSELLASIVGGLIGMIGACIGAWFTLWLQSRKERIKQLDKERLYVEYSAIKFDKEGYYIPSYGRIVSHSESNKIEDEPLVKALRNKVAFICCERTPASSMEAHYVIFRIVPL